MFKNFKLFWYNFIGYHPTGFALQAKSIVKVFDDTIQNLHSLNDKINQKNQVNSEERQKINTQLARLELEQIELDQLVTQNQNVIGKIKTLLS